MEYVSVIRGRQISARRADPSDKMFDPVKAALYFQRQGEIDEAFWMVFFFTHFGKHRWAGWAYAREVYGHLGEAPHWDWTTTSSNPAQFTTWLEEHKCEIKRRRNTGGFGNHRKYQSLDAYSPLGTGAAFRTYIDWVGPRRSHVELMEEALRRAGGDPKAAFDTLYQSMNMVASFGRTVTVPRAVWNFEWSLKGRILPGTFAENQAAINSPRSRPSSPLHTHCVSPSPFNIPSVLLYPLSVLYLILLLPIVRSVQLLVCGIPLNR